MILKQQWLPKIYKSYVTIGPTDVLKYSKYIYNFYPSIKNFIQSSEVYVCVLICANICIFFLPKLRNSLVHR